MVSKFQGKSRDSFLISDSDIEVIVGYIERNFDEKSNSSIQLANMAKLSNFLSNILLTDSLILSSVI